MRAALLGLLLLAPWLSHAAGPLDELCPNATASLRRTMFPSNVPPDVEQGSVEVDFTIRADGSIIDASVGSSTDPSFNAAAVAAVSKLSCTPQPADSKLRIPVEFVRPPPAPRDICSNYTSVMDGLRYPRAAYDKGLDSGEVIVDFKLSAQGDIREFYVIRTTDESFTAVALYGLALLKCKGMGRDVLVRVPFAFSTR